MLIHRLSANHCVFVMQVQDTSYGRHSRNQTKTQRSKSHERMKILACFLYSSLCEFSIYIGYFTLFYLITTFNFLGSMSKSFEGSSNEESKQIKTESDLANLVPELRAKAREQYLISRPEKQLALAQKLLEDEKYLFGDTELTEREKKRLRAQQEIVSLAKQVNTKTEEIQLYQMPDSFENYDTGKVDRAKKEELLMKRYKDTEKPLTETQLWEREQIAKATGSTATTGSSLVRTDLGVKQMDGKHYDLVFDDQIEFITNELAAGRDPLKDFLAMKAVEEKSVKDESKCEFDHIQEMRKKLPVYPYREELLEAVRKYPILIIVGETGSGKTTQVMQYLMEEGFASDGKMIGCTQPRRVAAMSVAARVAVEKGVKLGREVGYSIRFEECSCEKTQLKYMTDGMLLREFLTSPELDRYSVMMIDEAHERTLHTDVLFGLVKDISRSRKDLKLLISSATLDAKKFSDYFDDAPIFRIPGRRYPVDVYYTKAPESDYVDASVVTVLQIHATQPKGDILVFLPGQEDIEAVEEALLARMKGLGAHVGTKIMELLVLPIYASMPSEQQSRIFEKTPENARKVVLATNIAETSLTIDGITFVVDPGFCKQNSYNPHTGMEALMVVPVSKASAEQRKGRAGRVAPGKCFRLYTAFAFQHEMEENTVPEIQRTNLANVVLLLKSLGINDLHHFDFMDPPPAETLIRALELLYALGALNAEGNLTKIGRRMADLPLDPMLSKALLKSEDYACVTEMLTVAAMLSAGSTMFYRPKNKSIHADNAHRHFWRPGGDHITLLTLYQRWEEADFDQGFCHENFVQYKSLQRARDVRDQLKDMCAKVELDEKYVPPADSLEAKGPIDERVRKAITSGFFPNTAKLERDGTYKTMKKKLAVHIHPSSCLYIKDRTKDNKDKDGEGNSNLLVAPVQVNTTPPASVVYHELVKTSKEFMRQVIVIEMDWLTKIAPHYFVKVSEEMEKKTKQVNAKGKFKSAVGT